MHIVPKPSNRQTVIRFFILPRMIAIWIEAFLFKGVGDLAKKRLNYIFSCKKICIFQKNIVSLRRIFSKYPK